MNRCYFLAGATAVLHMLGAQPGRAQEAPALTRDVFTGEFPPQATVKHSRK